MRTTWGAATAAAALVIAAAGCGSTAAPATGPAPTRAADAAQLFSRPPGVGVACREAGSFACDRVGVAVWLRRPATGVTAVVNGLRLGLRPPRTSAGWWEGFLHPAGLIDGALRITPDRGRFYWQGTHPRSATVAVTATRGTGATDRATATVPLRAGWG